MSNTAIKITLSRGNYADVKEYVPSVSECIYCEGAGSVVIGDGVRAVKDLPMYPFVKGFSIDPVRFQDWCKQNVK